MTLFHALAAGLIALCAATGAGAARVVEPPSGAVFPADLRAPEFVWEDAGKSGPWPLRFTFADGTEQYFAPHRN